MGVKNAILGLLHYEDMHGYRIKNHLERNFGHMWTVNFGQIYPALKTMLDEGLVTMNEIGQENAPARKLYSITPKGKVEFIRWLESAPEKNMVLRDPFLLRFTFFAFGDKQHALDLIAGQIKVYEKQREQRAGNAARWERGNVYVRLISELGVGFNELMLDWLKRAAVEIEAEGKTKVKAS